jgi:hypothetical protein
MEDELYVSEELEELMYTHWLLKMREDYQRKQKEEADKRRALWELFFIANTCYLHDQEGCPECRTYGTATCCSFKEDYNLPHDF